MISDPHEFYRLLATTGIEVVAFFFASESVVWGSWRYAAEERMPSRRHKNKVLGAYVTCVDRLQL